MPHAKNGTISLLKRPLWILKLTQYPAGGALYGRRQRNLGAADDFRQPHLREGCHVAIVVDVRLTFNRDVLEPSKETVAVTADDTARSALADALTVLVTLELKGYIKEEFGAWRRL